MGHGYRCELMKKTILFLALIVCVCSGGPGILSASGDGPPDQEGGGWQDEAGERGEGAGEGEGEGPGPGERSGPPGGGRGPYGPPPGKRASMPVYKDCVARGEKAISLKKYSSAMKEFTKALVPLKGEDARKIYVYERLGWLNIKLNDIDSAQGYYLTATYQAEKLELFGKEALNSYRGAAYCFEKRGDNASAAENYEKALKISRDEAVRREIQKKLKLLKPVRKINVGK